MPLKIYNTLSKSEEVFEPLNPPTVKMYVCGPTVYDLSHLGHARTYIAFDVVRRYLEFLGYSVIYVVNITDVEDKIIKRAREKGVSPFELAEEYTKEYFKDIEALQIKKADINPKVTEHIEDIIEVVQGLIDKGY
ncbi:MAG: class I tRNA ligase family protein, partial [Candidatus Baldrarchaeia archaeon]